MEVKAEVEVDQVLEETNTKQVEMKFLPTPQIQTS